MLVYELKIADGGQSNFAASIDSSYHNHRFYRQWHEVIRDHQPQDGEIELQKGDLIEIHYFKFPSTASTGFGFNQRTKILGYYPLHKVKKYIKLIEYPGLA